MKQGFQFFLLGICLQTLIADAQPEAIKPRMRVIIDNDFGGDPDGMFQLVHHLLSPSVEIRAIIGSHLRAGDGFDTSRTTATRAKQKAEEILSIMHLSGKIPVYEGSNFALENFNKPGISPASEAIIKEAMRNDSKLPLYVVCGGGLTDIASAWLTEPEIAKRLTLIWIGGPEHEGLALPPPNAMPVEYNLLIDPLAAQVIFNQSSIPIWQVPRNVYRQPIISHASMKLHIENKGPIGKYLMENIYSAVRFMEKFNLNLGEVFILGDSPLVLLTALQSSFDADPSSSQYVLKHCPNINNKGNYEENNSGRFIRVYTLLDTRLMYDDFFSKLELFAKDEK